jgi:hypothetical protein
MTAKQRLLILDNVWDVELLRDLGLLTLGGTSSCIVTTRHLLDWHGVTKVALTTPLPSSQDEPPAFSQAMLASYVFDDPAAELKAFPSAVQVYPSLVVALSR